MMAIHSLSAVLVGLLLPFLALAEPRDAHKGGLRGAPADIDAAVQAWQLRVNDSAQIDQHTSLKVLSVGDSRCPVNVQCVWAGDANVTFLLTSPEGTIEHSAGLAGTIAVLPSKSVLKVEEVTPRPGQLPRPLLQSDYVVTVSITHNDTNDRETPDITPAPGSESVRWATALAKWVNAGNATDYTFDYRRSCFCMVDYVRPMHVRVAGGSVASAVYADDKTTVVPEISSSISTVPALFDHIRGVIGDDRYTLRVTYHDTLGYPTKVFTERKGTADGEFDVTMANLTISSATSSDRLQHM